jgi:hypothetical protein
MYYRPVSLSRELVAKLAFLTATGSFPFRETAESFEGAETGVSNFHNLEESKISDYGSFQNLEESVPKNGTLELQNLEESVPIIGTSEFQFPDINESKGIESNLTNQKECNQRVVEPVVTHTTTARRAAAYAIPEKLDLKGLKEAYRKAQAGQGPHRHRIRDTADVLGKAFRFAFDYPPDTGRLLKMAQVQPSGGEWSLIETILSLAGKKVWGNPHDYLQKVINNKQQQLKPGGEHREYGTRQSGWNYRGHRRPDRPDRTAEEIRREFENFRLPGS